MAIDLDATAFGDGSTITYSAYGGASLPLDVGDFLIAVLTTRDTGTEFPSITDGDPEYTPDLTTFVGAFTSPYRFMLGYYRPFAELGGGVEALSWEWLLGDVEASSIVVAAHQSGLVHWQNDHDDVGASSLSVSIGGSDGVVTVLFLLSEGGTTIPAADELIGVTPGAAMPAGHGYLEAWAFQGPGPHSLTATATSGNILFYYWVELAGGGAGSRWGSVGWPS